MCGGMGDWQQGWDGRSRGSGGVQIREGRRDGWMDVGGEGGREEGLIKPDLCHRAFMAVWEAGGRG